MHSRCHTACRLQHRSHFSYYFSKTTTRTTKSNWRARITHAPQSMSLTSTSSFCASTECHGTHVGLLSMMSTHAAHIKSSTPCIRYPNRGRERLSADSGGGYEEEEEEESISKSRSSMTSTITATSGSSFFFFTHKNPH